MRALTLLALLALPAVSVMAADAPSVTVAPATNLDPGSRALEKTTESAAIRDYVQAWENLRTALDANQAAPLAASFVGTAHDRLADTVSSQLQAGIHTRYQDLSHQIAFRFYSTEGASIELTDTVHYRQQVFAGDKLLATEETTARYLVVLTPAEVSWRVRVLQAEPTGR